MPQNDLQKVEPKVPAEATLETVTTSRRGLFLGMFAAGAFALSTMPSPARAAVSMLRTGLDPELVETEGDQLSGVEGNQELDTEAQLEEVRYYYRRRRGRYWRRRRRRRRPRFGLWIRI
jgi:hypothetical protein